MKIGGTRPKTLLLGCLIGVAGGVARDISAVANTSVLAAPLVTESVGLGIAIYMLAAIGLGIALAFGRRTLSPHQPSTADGSAFMIAAFSTVAVVGAVVGWVIGIARATAHAEKVLAKKIVWLRYGHRCRNIYGGRCLRCRQYQGLVHASTRA
jgi:hypothetical protein